MSNNTPNVEIENIEIKKRGRPRKYEYEGKPQYQKLDPKQVHVRTAKATCDICGATVTMCTMNAHKKRNKCRLAKYDQMFK